MLYYFAKEGFRRVVPSAAGKTSFADVAQLVEQRFRKPQVTGSNPVVGSSFHLKQREREISRCRLDGGIRFDPQNFLVVTYSLSRTRLRIVGVQRLRARGRGR